MVLGKRYALASLLFCSFGAGCSFHSNQLDALKTIFREDSGPQSQWVFSWEDRIEKVFAVNAGSSVFFANSDGILVHFNGVFVEKIEGVRLNPRIAMDISITKTRLDGSEIFRYEGAASDFGDIHCEPPSEIASDLAVETDSMRVIKIAQKCLAGERVVEQSIILNQARQLMALQFFVHPTRQPVTIRYGQIKDLSMY